MTDWKWYFLLATLALPEIASKASSAKNLKIHIRSWFILAQAEFSGPVEMHYFWNAMQSEAHSE